MKTVEMVKLYKVVDGKLMMEETEPNKVKNYVGWKKDAEEAILTKITHADLNVQNKVSELNKLVVDLLEVKSLAEDLKINISNLPEKNAYGTSLNSVDVLVGNLIKLCEVK